MMVFIAALNELSELQEVQERLEFGPNSAKERGILRRRRKRIIRELGVPSRAEAIDALRLPQWLGFAMSSASHLLP